ncbi:pentapeptide repeat-containing protein [Umezawaea sp.]|uniref:pentapeptide repeat-containing protein n=1 Tax=Umezawaea sp. TaxID=1955258 RepID=UPI002ED5E41D
MTSRTFRSAAVAVVLLVLVVVASLKVLPPLFYPDLTDAELRGVAGAEVRVQLQQAQGQLQNNVRSALLQLTAGLLVVIGAAATWWQVQVNREGQLTDRLTRAVEQIGSANADVRIGGIYALKRIAENSPADRDTVQFILGAFIRNNSPRGDDAGDGELPEERRWLLVDHPDIQTAVEVLAQRISFPRHRADRPSTRRRFPDDTKLYLSRVNLRGVQVHRGGLINTQLRHSDLAHSWMRGTVLDGSDLKSADLRGSFLRETSFVDTNLALARLSGSDLREADLRRADLRGADLRDADLTGARLEGALADATTSWPADVDAEHLARAGVSVTGAPA